MQPEVLVAYAMNDDEIPPDHGFPLRLIVPGYVGARNVKWLEKICLSETESESHWQKKDYRYASAYSPSILSLYTFSAFSPSVQSAKEADYDSVPAIQEYPVQSSICVPESGTKISIGKLI